MEVNPLLLEIPAKLETERLILRAPINGDGAIVNKAKNDSINELKKWLHFAQKSQTVEQTEVIMREEYIRFLKRESFRFLILSKESNDFIGITNLFNFDWRIPKCEIGYWIHTKFSHQGYMTEAVKELTAFGVSTLGCKRIEIPCDDKI